MENLDVIALGGNAILPAGQAGTIYEQFAITRVTMARIARLVAAGRNVVLTHGNGPIVGNIVLRNEAMRDTIPPMPLGICVADSQGGIGYMLQQVLRNALVEAGAPRKVVTLVTQVLISPDDPALDNPTKPIGPFYTKEKADEMARANGWRMVEDSQRGYRRVVPSPRPLEIIEESVVTQLLERGSIVVTVGGGGIPVVRKDDKLDGVEAVVDKDYATAVLARDLRAERMIVVTDVDAVYRNYGGPDQEAIRSLSADEARDMAASLPAGSMGSKLEAAAQFVVAAGGVAIITRPDELIQAVEGDAGTHVTADGKRAQPRSKATR
jgi:carbamate kinase